MQYVHIDQADDYVIPIPLALVGLLQDIAPVGVLWEARLHLEGVAPGHTERVEVEPFGLPFSYDGDALLLHYPSRVRYCDPKKGRRANLFWR